jgi:hypothetical protein
MEPSPKDQFSPRTSYPKSPEKNDDTHPNKKSDSNTNLGSFTFFYIKNFIRRNNIAVTISLLAAILALMLLAVLKNWVGLLLIGTSALISFSCHKKNAFQKNTLQEKFLTAMKLISLLIILGSYIWLVRNIDFWIGTILFSSVVIIGIIFYYIRSRRIRNRMANQVRYTI